MSRDPEVTAAALTDVAYFVEDDDGNLSTVYDGEVIHAELVDEPEPESIAAVKVRKLVAETVDEPEPAPVYTEASAWLPARMQPASIQAPGQTAWLPKVPQLNPPPAHPRYAEWVPEADPRRRTPDGDNPIFDELDQRRGKKSWTKTMHQLRTRLTRYLEQHQLEEGAHRDRLWTIEHASEVLNQLRRP